MGEFALARPYLEEAKDFHDDNQHRILALHYGTAPESSVLPTGLSLCGLWVSDSGSPMGSRAIRLARRLKPTPIVKRWRSIIRAPGASPS